MVPRKSEDGVEFSRTQNLELQMAVSHHVGDGFGTRVLSESSKFSLPLGHLSRLAFYTHVCLSMCVMLVQKPTELQMVVSCCLS